MRDQRDENYTEVLQELKSYFTLRESWGLGHVRISYEKCKFHKGLFWSPRICESHEAIRMPYTSNKSYCHRRFYGTYIDRKTRIQREIQIGRDTIEGTMLSLLRVKQRVLTGPCH